MELIDNCYSTHHLQFDDDGVLWLSGDSFVIGWSDPARYDAYGPQTLEAVHGWSEKPERAQAVARQRRGRDHPF